MPVHMIKLEKEKDSDSDLSCCNESHYPYGTRLRFEDDLIKQLDMSEMEVGQVVEVHALAVIQSKSEHKDEESESKDISLQLTSIGVSKEQGDLTTRLYPTNDKQS